MKKIALVTYHKLPNLTADDRLALDHLIRHDITPQAVIWDTHDVAWNSFDAIILRSCWDYYLRHEEFLSWIESLEKINAPLWNLPRVVKWNMDKTYLRTLSAQGVSIAPSVWVEKGAPANLKKILEAQGWEGTVVKPTISATAYQTWMTTPENAESNQAMLNEILNRSGALIQKFVGEVQVKGEWSFIFFGGKYSHAVLKRPKNGDFRVQEEYGGSSEAKNPDQALIKQAQDILESVAEPLLYARVDAVEINEKLTLMELELIEPVLFLSHHPLAPQRFAEAIIAGVDKTHSHKKPVISQ